MKTLSIICVIVLITFVYNNCDLTAKTKEDWIKGTSGDNHCCWTTALNVSVCGAYDKAAYDLIPKTIEEGKKTDPSFNIDCGSQSSSGSTSSSFYLKIGIITLLAILF